MSRAVLVVAAMAALAVPAAALADDTPTAGALATQTCKSELAQSPATFKQTYGTNASRSNAFGACVSKHTASAGQEAQNAAKACKAERDADTSAFTKKYGSNTQAKGKGAGSDAYGRCVSAKATAAAQSDAAADVEAAKACKAERGAGAAAFATKYGAARNAFGKCVAAKAKTAR